MLKVREAHTTQGIYFPNTKLHQCYHDGLQPSELKIKYIYGEKLKLALRLHACSEKNLNTAVHIKDSTCTGGFSSEVPYLKNSRRRLGENLYRSADICRQGAYMPLNEQ